MLSRTKGILIAVEGIDGSGKSTLLHSLEQHVRSLVSIPVITTKEPGGTPLGKQLRALVQERTVAICSQAEYLLFATDRAQHFNELIIPALNDGKIIISDRMADSSLVYQGYGRGLDKQMITSINTWVMHGIKPDLTLYVRITPDIAYERLIARKQNLTSFEQEKRAFFDKLVDGFDTLYAQRSDVCWLDGTKKPDEITQEALKNIMKILPHVSR